MITMTTNAGVVADEFRHIAVDVPAQANAAVKQGAEILLLTIQAHASGRPGPDVITDQYRSSWRIDVQSSTEIEFVAEVGTDEPYGYRLEMGFVGTDAADRNYNQPPYPHVEPAVIEVGPKIELMVLATVPS